MSDAFTNAVVAALKGIGAKRVHTKAGAIIAEIPLERGRSQVVRIETHRGRRSLASYVRVRSRAAVPENHDHVTTALEFNARSVYGICALVTDTSPPVIDVAHNLPVLPNEPFNVTHLIDAVYSVASLADSLEEHIAGDDIF
ncbi:hypothetical protein Pla123a_43290 [Posidoniimonas polymericola]|uniref:Uncharacterized protein n=1 Tax=Posidoniimonas polymericola TaxID=2528002 RepID=A0A5C5XWI0_9BACT|nr:hypothetical protein [Posidoniimonas polymericola]TWT66901.1 hypothetical protein Pla123a_43290 [Posidoniimonas polymericola]